MQPSTVHYELGSPPVTGAGIGFSEEHIDSELAGSVATLVFDDAGARDLGGLLDGLADTDFSRENLAALLADHSEPEDWRVGEAVAECYLIDCRGCFFPWPDGRDERKQGSSLPGADLVGFQLSEGIDRFAFGEVKTSSEAATPPNVMYGRHGLKQQLEDLRDSQDLRNGLVRYIAHRAHNASWRDRFQRVCSSYLRNTRDVCLFGVLVRDTPPHQDDLRARVTALGSECPAGMAIELTALHLPLGNISRLSARVVASRQKAGAP